MSSVITPPLVAGQKLTREEFLRRWESMPRVKRAELIGGLVYMPSPVSFEHGSQEILVSNWIGQYAIRTPGLTAASNCTWLMLEDAPQPDVSLCVLPQYGGQSRIERGFGAGAPELAAEVCLSRASYDLGPKQELYRAAGVREYVAVLLAERSVLWRRLVQGEYIPLEPGSDGVLRSVVFSGLWLDPAALLAGDGMRVMEVLNQGLRSAEHGQFAPSLAARHGP